MCDHLLIAELVALGALDDVVEDEHDAVVGRLEDEDVLEFGLLVVQDLVDFERHGLPGPHVVDLAEPAIFDRGVRDFGHGERGGWFGRLVFRVSGVGVRMLWSAKVFGEGVLVESGLDSRITPKKSKSECFVCGRRHSMSHRKP